MTEPDYDKLLQQADSCKAAQPLVRQLANAIRTLRVLKHATTGVNQMLVERDKLLTDEIQGLRQDLAHEQQRANTYAEDNERQRHELECLRAQHEQRDYPCSPHCSGYLREQAALSQAEAMRKALEPTEENLLKIILASKEHQRKRLSQGEAVRAWEDEPLWARVGALEWAKDVLAALSLIKGGESNGQ